MTPLRVQLLALAGQDRRVHRLRQQGMPEAEAAGVLVRGEDAVLDRPTQRVAHVALGESGRPDEQWISHVAPGSGGEP